MKTATTAPNLSIVLLCYKTEEHFVPYATQIIKAFNVVYSPFEMILVANYDAHDSTDKTPAMARCFASENKKCRVVARAKEGGMGWDLRSGLEIAQGEKIMFLDGDGQTPVEDMVRLWNFSEETVADIWGIYRTPRRDGAIRKAMTLIFNTSIRILFPRLRVRDINAKPKILTRRAYEIIQPKNSDWFIDAEVLLAAVNHHFTIRQIPGAFEANTWRKSFVNLCVVFEFITNMIKARFHYWFTPKIK
ncbi:MAG TPA: glycosyltransferase [Turneriella sp.]|nr:glycosyltransferase [Turneriella sp.]